MHQDIERNLNQIKELKVGFVAFPWPILIQFFIPEIYPSVFKKNKKQKNSSPSGFSLSVLPSI